MQRARGGAIRFVHLELFDLTLLRVELGLVLGVVLLFTVLGPLGTKEVAAPVVRFVYWVTCAAACWPICRAQDAMTLYYTRSWTTTMIVLATTVGSLVTAIPCAAVVTTFCGAFFGSYAAKPTFVEVYAVLALLLVGITSLLHYIACQLVEIRYWLRATGAAPPPTPAPVAEPELDATDQSPPLVASSVSRKPEPRSRAVPEQAHAAGNDTMDLFLQHLPDHLGRDIISLKAVEHYVEVSTSSASALLLMRFGDAVAQLGQLGIRVHRSHWVAHRHARSLVRDGHRSRLHLANGATVPVSRTYRDAVREFLQRCRPGDAD